MDPKRLRALLEQVRDGTTGVSDALSGLRNLPFEELDGLTLDHHRELRTGLPEAVFGEGKSPAQIQAAMKAIADRGQVALATRVSEAKAAQIVASLPLARHDPVSRTVCLGGGKATGGEAIAVVCAGTSDLPVAEEAAVTLEAYGRSVVRVRDVGVAGLPRVLSHRRTLWAASAVIVVAGMDGALPSVVAGLIDRPVVAVPTSVGYGASFGGLAALLAMLSSCAPGVSVVNIDNGFGAACAVARIVA